MQKYIVCVCIKQYFTTHKLNSDLLLPHFYTTNQQAKVLYINI